MKNVLYLVLLTLLVFPVSGQEWETTSTDAFKAALLKCSEIYRGTNYALTIENRIYRNQSNPSDVIVQKGTFLRGEGKAYRSEQASQLVIQTSKVKLVVDTVSKMVAVMHPDTLFDALNLTAMLQNENWNSVQCAIKNDRDYTSYRITGVQGFENILFKIHKKTNQLRELIATLPADNYLSEQLDDETTEQPRIELSYSPPVKLTQAQKESLTLAAWVVEKGDSFSLVPSHLGYNLEDLRYSPR